MPDWKTRPSTSTYPLIDRSVDEALAVVAGAGFERVDVLGRKPHFTPEAEGVRAVREASRRHGVAVANLGNYGGKGFAQGDEAEARRELDETRRVLDAAAELGARSIRGYRISSKEERAEHLPRLISWYARAAEHAESVGVTIGVECHGGAISGDPERLAELCRGVGSASFGVIYDPCNLLIHGTDPHAAFERLREHIVHVHLKDGRRDDPASPKHTMLGEGEVDIARVVSELESIEYQGDVTLEYEAETVPAAEGLAAWRATYRGLVG